MSVLIFTLVLVIFLNVVTGFDIHLHVYGAISTALCHCFKAMCTEPSKCHSNFALNFFCLDFFLAFKFFS